MGLAPPPFLNNVQKTALFLRDGFPYMTEPDQGDTYLDLVLLRLAGGLPLLLDPPAGLLLLLPGGLRLLLPPPLTLLDLERGILCTLK